MLLQSLPIRCNQAFGIHGLVIISVQVANAKKKRFTYILFLASSNDRPWRVKKDRSCVATPMPDEPAPKNRMRCSVNGKPEAADAKRAAFINPESTTAPGKIYHESSQRIDDSQTCALNLGWHQYPFQSGVDQLTSSLKHLYCFLNISRYRKALSVEKSSNWTSNRGDTSAIASMNSRMNSSILAMTVTTWLAIQCIAGAHLWGIWPLATNAKVERIVKELLRVGAEVQAYGESRRRFDSGSCNVQISAAQVSPCGFPLLYLQFANTDRQTVGTKIPETKNP